MKCGKPYCACVGTCFAQHSPLDDAGQLKGHPTPPAQPVKPLTEDQIKEALVRVDPETKRLPPGFLAFARAIEAAHGIKE